MSVGPLTGESNSAMSTEDSVAMRGSQAPAIDTGPTKRATMEVQAMEDQTRTLVLAMHHLWMVFIASMAGER